MPRGRRANRDGSTRGKFNRVTGSYRIGGLEVAFDPDLDLDSKAQPTPLFPEYKPPSPAPLAPKEKIQIAHFRSIRAAIHEGPYFSVLGDSVRVDKAIKTPAANFDPFEGMPTYSQKYTKRRRTLPRMDTRPHVMKFFPKELWSTLDLKAGMTNGVVTGNMRLKLAKMRQTEGAGHVDGKMVADGDDVEEAHKEVNDDEDDPMEDIVVDDEFEEDDDEGGDYNAEGYFDDGGDDTGGDYGGDDGDGGDYY